MDSLASFREAVSNGDFKNVQAFISRGIDVNDGGKDKHCALHWAAQNGSVEMCRCLVEAGAQLNLKNARGMTPTMLAVSANQRHVVEFFLRFNVDINERNDKGDTALHIAAKRGHVELLIFLTNKGADITRRNNNGDLAEVTF